MCPSSRATVQPDGAVTTGGPYTATTATSRSPDMVDRGTGIVTWSCLCTVAEEDARSEMGDVTVLAFTLFRATVPATTETISGTRASRDKGIGPDDLGAGANDKSWTAGSRLAVAMDRFSIGAPFARRAGSVRNESPGCAPRRATGGVSSRNRCRVTSFRGIE